MYQQQVHTDITGYEAGQLLENWLLAAQHVPVTKQRISALPHMRRTTGNTQPINSHLIDRAVQDLTVEVNRREGAVTL
jgi:hypothetical protein